MADFYERLASEYDQMVGASARADKAERFMREIVLAQPCQALLDVACGTGLYALAAAGCGVRNVHGVDLSPAMLEQAIAQAARAGLGVRFHQAGMEALDSLALPTFEVIVCLGNSLPHLLEAPTLAATLAGFHRRLAANGRLFVQLLNYDLILRRRERIVEVTREAQIDYIRFYDFLDELLRFNLLRLDWSRQPPATRLDETTLKPYRQTELAAALAAAGFVDLQAFDGLGSQPFDPAHSATLTLLARRG